LDGNGYVLGQLIIEDIQNLGIVMDEQIIVVASIAIHYLSIHIENLNLWQRKQTIPCGYDEKMSNLSNIHVINQGMT
jgi:Na+-transporting NADH:ubiquinone oxidoreductase subunit NqrD